MTTFPLGSLGAAEASIAKRAEGTPAAGEVWVLEDGRGRPDASCLAVAERLGLEFRRLTLAWTWRGAIAAFAQHGSLAGLKTKLPLLQGAAPAVTLSSGRRSGAVAAWLKQATGSRMVHHGACGGPASLIDFHLLDRDATTADPPALFPVLGAPHRTSPLLLAGLRARWAERLDHLPRPLLALMVGNGPFGAELRPSEAHRLARCLASAARSAGGAVLAVTNAHTGAEASDALTTGLGDCLHLIYRAGEPGPDATLGFMASANAIVVAGNAPSFLLEACATEMPVYVANAGPFTGTMRRLSERLIAAGHVRPLTHAIESWNRHHLDEAGRVAQAIRARCLLPG